MNALHAYQKIERRIVELELSLDPKKRSDAAQIVRERKATHYSLDKYRPLALALNTASSTASIDSLIEEFALALLAERSPAPKASSSRGVDEATVSSVDDEEDSAEEVTADEADLQPHDLHKENVSKTSKTSESSSEVSAELSKSVSEPASSVALEEPSNPQALTSLSSVNPSPSPIAIPISLVESKSSEQRVEPLASPSPSLSQSPSPSSSLSLDEVDSALEAHYSSSQPRRCLKVPRSDWKARAQALALATTTTTTSATSTSTSTTSAPHKKRVFEESPPNPHPNPPPPATTTKASAPVTAPTKARASASASALLSESERRIALLESELARSEAAHADLAQLCVALGKRAKVAEDKHVTLQALLSTPALNTSTTTLTNTGSDALSDTRALRFVLLDTNIFMHRLLHVKTLLAAPQVVLIVPLVVLRELDALKCHKVDATAQLAREAMRYLQEVSRDVTKVRGQAPHELWQPPLSSGFSACSNDDWIINCARYYADHFSKERVTLVSEDRNLTLKARLHYDVHALSLDDALTAECRVHVHYQQQQQQQQQQHAMTAMRQTKECQWRDTWRRSPQHKAMATPQHKGFAFDATGIAF